jgi:glycosyltransferase involved in cell wall biosynthesis
MRVLHLLALGDCGGIEKLICDYSNVSKLDNVYVFAWGGGPIYDTIVSNGHNCVNMSLPRDKAIANTKKIIKLCKEINPDVILIHHAAPAFKIAAIYIKKHYSKIKIIMYAHSNAEDICKNGNKIKSFINKFIQKCGYKKADKVVAISNSVKNSFTKYFSTSEKSIVTIYNGVNIDAFSISNRIPSDKIEIIYVGRLIKEKGVQNILYALEGIEIDYHLKIVGDGPFRGELVKITEEHNLKDVEFCGSRGDVPELLNSSEIFIHMPNWEEGFGITVVEAMAAGKICIVANSGAMPEIITDGVNGFIVEKGNILALKEKIQEVSKDINSEYMQQIRENAVKRARDFSIENFARNLDKQIANI